MAAYASGPQCRFWLCVDGSPNFSSELSAASLSWSVAPVLFTLARTAIILFSALLHWPHGAGQFGEKDAIGDLRKLKQLYLSNNQLIDLPEAVGELTQLEKLDLVGNQLIDLPETIGDLINLRELDLSNNQFTALPEVISRLTCLRALFISRNRLRNLPTAIGALKKLTVLHLHNNQLEELPYSIGELLKLEKLRLESNKLQSLPVELAKIPRLGLIHVAQTDITHDDLLSNGWPKDALNRVDFGNPPQQKHKPPLRTHSDTATDEDQLGRGPAAEALAARMNLIWQRHAKNQHTDPLVMHLNAPWGAGKSSYFLLLRKFLKSPSTPIPGEDNSDEDSSGEKNNSATRPEAWAVVQMNAWQHQHVGAPWWSLFQIIFEQSKTQTNTPSAEYNIGWREAVRRFHGRKLRFLVAAGLTLVGLSVILFGGPGGEILSQMLFEGNSDTKSDSTTANLVALFMGLPVAAGGLIKSVHYFRDTLLPGDAATAERWTSVHKDPRNRLKEHFKGLVDDLEKPLLVFIDDLDRCQPKYVVELLENIMTIFRHSKVFFLVAADGQWITRCFELEYKDFKDYHSDPGRSLGHHFLEKIFQFSIPLPQASNELRNAYWTLLTEPDLEVTAPSSQDPDHIIKLFWAFRHVLAHDFRKFRRFIFDKANEKKAHGGQVGCLILSQQKLAMSPSRHLREKANGRKGLMI